MNKYINEIFITSGYFGEKKDYPKTLRQDQWVKTYVRICNLKRSGSKEFQECLSKIHEHNCQPFYDGWNEVRDRLQEQQDKIDDQISESTDKDMDEITEHLKENRKRLKELEKKGNVS
jgi:hypothetical protein|tara:strand:+ start:334 stop:687 length:354 start_codon:yes stop_codon:yes gene_type:complete